MTDDHYWQCRRCKSLVPNSDMACINCGLDGRTEDGRSPRETKPSSAGWRERMLREDRERHSEREKRPEESSRDYALRSLATMKQLAREVDAKWKAAFADE